MPRLAGTLRRYLDFADSDVPGPGGVVPRVLISVLDDERHAALQGLIRRLPPPAGELFVVCRESKAAAVLVSELLGDEALKPP